MARLPHRIARSLLLAAALLQCALPQLRAAPPAGYYLVWADELNGTSLDSTKWIHQGLGQRRDATNTTNAISFNTSNLVITTYTLFTTNGSTVSTNHYTGMLSTSGKFHLRRGYTEASVNYDDSLGMWSAYWAQSPTMGKFIGDAFTSGVEFDVCEHRKQDSSGNNIDGTVQSNIHWDGYGTYHQSVGSGNIGSSLGTGYHAYGWEWTPSLYRIWIDGVSKWTTSTALSGHSEYLLLSSEVQNGSWAGSIPAGGYGSLATSTTKMLIDYVRYYAPTTMVFWDGSASASWADTNNWVAGLSPKTTDEVLFSYLSNSNRATTLGQDVSIKSLTFLETGGAVTISNNTLTLGSGGLDLISASSDPTIYSRLVLGAAQTWSIATNRTLNVSGEIAGAANLTLDHPGTLRLAVSNSFTGTLTLSDGLVSLGHSDGLGNAAGATIVGSSAQLMIASGTYSTVVDEPLTLYGNTNGVYAAPLRSGSSAPAVVWTGPIVLGSDAAIQLDGSRTLTLSNAVAVQGTNFDLTLAGDGGSAGTVYGDLALGSGGLTKLGSGTWRLYSATTFTGDTRIGGGTLALYATNALQLSTVNLDTNDTGTLQLSAAPVILGGLKGDRALNAGSTALIVGSNTQNTVYGGVLSGTGRFTKVGAGTLTLTGTNALSGGFTIEQGTLQLGSNTAGGSVVGTITNNARLRIYRTNALTLANPLRGSGTLDVVTPDGLTVNASSPVTLGGDVNVGQGAYGKLLLAPGAAVTCANVALGNSANNAGDVVQSGGSFTVSNWFRVGHYPGETSSYTLGGGTLTLVGTPTGIVNQSGVAEQAGILYLGIDGTGLFTQISGVARVHGLVLDGRTATTNNDTFTLNGGSFLVGPSGIKSGSLDANTSYQVNLGGGTLGAWADWASSRPMTLTGTNGNTTFDTDTNAVTLTGALSGPGGIVKQGSGTLTLTAVESYSGLATVSNGALNLAGELIGGGTLTVAPAARLTGTGTNLGPLVVNGTLAPGNGVGRFVSGPTTWNSGGTYNWEINNPTNSSGWDLLSVSGSLNVAAAPAANFAIKPLTLTAGGVPGLLAGFNNQSNYTWLLATATGGIVGLNPNDFAVDAGGFSNDLAGGAFTVEQSGNSVVLKFHANTSAPQVTGSAMLADGSFRIVASGVPGKAYAVQAVTNLSPPAAWVTLANVTTDVNGTLQFTDTQAATLPLRYYRLYAP